MNKCLNCNKETKNKKFCGISCQNKFQRADLIDKKLGLNKEFIVKCNKCGKEILVQEREKLFPKKNKYFCSRSCANSREHSEKTKEKIGDKIKENLKINPREKRFVRIFCKKCSKEFEVTYAKRHRKFCCVDCAVEFMRGSNASRTNGLISVYNQKEKRRSKNEIYFAELCKEKFSNVLTNEPIFNGWDADVILEDYRIAVLWNGKWHYEKVKQKHSVKQVQSRDKIKTKEIFLKGYVPYVIKDLGKQNKEFVEKEFEKFLKFITPSGCSAVG